MKKHQFKNLKGMNDFSVIRFSTVYKESYFQKFGNFSYLFLDYSNIFSKHDKERLEKLLKNYLNKNVIVFNLHNFNHSNMIRKDLFEIGKLTI